MKKYWLLGILAFMLCGCPAKTSSFNSSLNSSSSSIEEPQSAWPTPVLNIIYQACNGFDIPYFPADRYDAKIDSSSGTDFAIINCYGFDIDTAVQSYTSTLETQMYSVEDYTEDYGCYYATKPLSTALTSIIQYNLQSYRGVTYFMIATAVSGYGQSSQTSTTWPKEAVELVLDTDIPHFDADLYEYAGYSSGDGAVGIIINCYLDDVSTALDDYAAICLKAGYAVQSSFGAYYATKDNITIITYVSDYEGEDSYLVIYAYAEEENISSWPADDIYYYTGLTIPEFTEKNITYDYGVQTQDGSSFYCIWAWGASDHSLADYCALLEADGWVLDEEATPSNLVEGYVYYTADDMHIIEIFFYPASITGKSQDCLFIMLR